MEVITYWAETETGVLGQYEGDRRTNDTSWPGALSLVAMSKIHRDIRYAECGT